MTVNYEKLAVDAVADAIAITDYLDPYVTENDKGPSWDGKFTVYSKPGNKHKKSDWLGEVPVQVKSVQKTNLSQDEIKYPVEISDLKNYLRIGGTMYFVVYITPIALKKIYYCSFLPFDLQKILKQSGKKKTKSLPFRPFPIGKNDITNIIMDCLRDMEKQSLLKNRDYGMDDAAKEFDISKLHYSMTLSGVGYTKANILEQLLNRDVYFYAQSDSGSITFPVEHMTAAKSIVEELAMTVGAGNVDYYDKYQIVHKKEGKEFRFGKSFTIVLSRDKVKFNYKLAGNLKERILDLSFVINLIESRVLRINEHEIPLNAKAEELKSFDIAEMKEQSEFLNRVDEILHKLGIKKELNIEDISDKDYEYIKILLRAFENGESIKFKEDNIPPIVPLKVSNLNIILLFKPVGEREYEILDFFKNDLKVVSQNEVDESDVFYTSQYTILDKECLVKYDNVDYGRILENVKRFESDGHYNRVNVLGLNLLMAYDETKNNEFLECAKNLFQWLYEKDSKGMPLYLMNIYQCKMRIGELSSDDKSKIYEMLVEYKDNPKFLGGLYCLLKEKEQVQKMIDKMTKVEADEFMKYPIYKLLEE